jgi:DNA-directed RNA polymerase subunit L
MVMSQINDIEAARLQRMLIMQMDKEEFDASDLTIGDLVKGVIGKNKKLNAAILNLEHQKKLLIIALKNQRQPHMDYIPELERTAAELLKELEDES